MTRKERILYPIFAALMPLIPMLYLYARNARLLDPGQVALVCAALALGSALLYLLLFRLTRHAFPGLLGCALAWVCFFSYTAVGNGLDSLLGGAQRYPRPVLLAAFAVVWVCCVLLSAQAARRWTLKTANLLICVICGVLLLQNAVPLLLRTGGSTGGTQAYRTEFTVDESLPKPNIYWFHMDGMLGFDAMEQYFGDAQPELTRALESRGFVLNRGATLKASHMTMIAVPVLMSPQYYDDVLWAELEQYYPRLRADLNRDAIHQYMNFRDLSQVRRHNELTTAMGQAGYSTATVGFLNYYYYPITDLYFDYQQPETPVLLPDEAAAEVTEPIEKARELTTLLWKTSLLEPVAPLVLDALDRYEKERLIWQPATATMDLTAYTPEDPTYRALGGLALGIEEAMQLPAPRFTIVMDLMAHYPFTLDAEGRTQPGDPEDLYSYPAQHAYAGKHMLALVDLILAQDPDAVIVLQADHGLHGQSAAQIIEGVSGGVDDVIALWDGVLSAVRVPEAYGGLSAPLYPQDIARYLVNHFVGENYGYLGQGPQGQ